METTNNKKLLGKRIKEIRKSFGYTQEQFSEIIDIETSSLSGIESGRFFPSLHVVEKMSNALEVPMVEFFKFVEIPAPQNLPIEVANIMNNLNLEQQETIYKIIKAGFAIV